MIKKCLFVLFILMLASAFISKSPVFPYEVTVSVHNKSGNSSNARIRYGFSLNKKVEVTVGLPWQSSWSFNEAETLYFRAVDEDDPKNIIIIDVYVDKRLHQSATMKGTCLLLDVFSMSAGARLNAYVTSITSKYVLVNIGTKDGVQKDDVIEAVSKNIVIGKLIIEEVIGPHKSRARIIEQSETKITYGTYIQRRATDAPIMKIQE